MIDVVRFSHLRATLLSTFAIRKNVISLATLRFIKRLVFVFCEVGTYTDLGFSIEYTQEESAQKDKHEFYQHVKTLCNFLFRVSCSINTLKRTFKLPGRT